jgi:prevent-host-death family protein
VFAQSCDCRGSQARADFGVHNQFRLHGGRKMNATTLTTFSAKDAKARFGELLDTAMGRPVGITKHERLTAYLVSKFDYEAMLGKLQELEDRLWLIEAENAHKDGFVGSETVDTLLSKLRNFDNEEIRNK